MTWFAFQGSGSVYNLNGLAEKELVFTGAHGYATEAEAKAHPNGPANPEQAILLAEFEAAASAPVGGSTGGVQQGTTKAADIKTPLDWLKATFTRQNAIRLAEGTLGLVLILIAVAELGKGTAVGAAVKKVPFI